MYLNAYLSDLILDKKETWVCINATNTIISSLVTTSVADLNTFYRNAIRLRLIKIQLEPLIHPDLIVEPDMNPDVRTALDMDANMVLTIHVIWIL